MQSPGTSGLQLFSIDVHCPKNMPIMKILTPVMIAATPYKSQRWPFFVLCPRRWTREITIDILPRRGAKTETDGARKVGMRVFSRSKGW